MLKPEYIQKLPDRMIHLYEQAEADILVDMARRISQYDYWIPAVEHQAKMLEEAGMVREEIIARMKRLTGKTEQELTELMKEAGTAALKSDDEVYQRNGLVPSPVAASADLQKVLQAGYDQTAGEFRNMTLTTARTATQQFERALDRAYMQIVLGGMDYNISIRNAIKQLSADGVGAIKYPSGRVDSIEVAVRRAIVTGVNQTALKLQDRRADEMGCDLVEVSAHSGARPEHAKWQGGIYSRSGKSRKYPDFKKTTGYGTALGLGGINCSHSFRPYFEGMSRTYSEEMLEEYEAKKFEYNGKKLTEYEALQEQRKIERQIRRWKREQNAMNAAGLDASEAAAKVREWNTAHRDFLEQTGLKPDGTRLVVGKTVEKTAQSGIINKKNLRFEELGSLRLSDENLNKILQDERLLVKETIEHAVVYDMNGKVLFRQAGQASAVDITEEQFALMKGAIATHNHPRGATLSPQDIYLLKESGLAEIRACTIDGVHIMTQPDTWDQRLSSYKAINQEYRDLLKPHKERYLEMVRDGKISLYDANIKYQQRTMDDFVKKFKLDYRFERRD